MMAARVTSGKKWRKILYEDQDVPDNYVDRTFLEEMKKNLYTRTYQFWPSVVESGVVTQQISSVCVFVVSFIYMRMDWMSPQLLFVASSSLAMAGYIIYSVLNSNQSVEDDEPDGKPSRTIWDDVKTTCVFLSFGYGLSPVLMTLTDTISTDTIYAMTAAMLLANLLFHDYGPSAAMVSQSLSLNAAIFASVCLASRLPTVWHAFATVTFAVEVFALWPLLRRKIKVRSRRSFIALTALLQVCACALLVSVSLVASVLVLVAHLFISVACPLLLIKLQPYKNNIYGPWDEAVIRE